ncbi:MAG: hypothetical protein AB7I50_04235 [Vicinamibacterales bacterium]
MKTILRSVIVVFATASLSATLSAEVGAPRAQGRPTFSEGKALGYFVWQEGDTWKVRWTTFGSNHRFTGRVALEGGELRSFKRVDADTERRVIAPGRAPRAVRGPRGRVVGVRPGRGAVVAEREEDHINQESEQLIVFNTRTDDDIDGFDFKVTDNTRRIRLNLQIDGENRAGEIEIGRSNFKPNEDPLVISVQ